MNVGMEEQRTNLKADGLVAPQGWAAIVHYMERLGMTSVEVDRILSRHVEEPAPAISLGPRHYPGGFYGAVSILDF